MPRQVWSYSLSELRTRADYLASSFQQALDNSPHAEEALRRGVVLSRRLARLLNRPDLRPERARHHARRTLRYLECWKGIPYFDLIELARDVTRWSDEHGTEYASTGAGPDPVDSGSELVPVSWSSVAKPVMWPSPG